ncbi:hypothetical protein FOPE_04384 [Fonsecaea pedrosoi]|nr:hypothetical protein FOPE_04384 [Fonsecaea pedrosoi]
MVSEPTLGERRRHYSSRIQGPPPSITQQQPHQWPLERPKNKTRVLTTRAGKLSYVDSAQGVINPRNEPYKAIFKSVAGYDKLPLPRSHQVMYTSLNLRKYLDRTHCLMLLHALSKQRVKIWLKIGNRPMSNVHVDQATVLILSIALRSRSGEKAELVGELIGLAHPRTLEYLARYIRPPLCDASIIASLVNATVRQYTQPRRANNGELGSFQLFRLVPPIIADLLMKLDQRTTTNFLKGVLTRLITSHPNEHKERGMKLGLLLVGIRKALRRLLENDKKNRSRFELLVDCVFGLLSSAGPLGVGGALTVVQLLVKQIWKAKGEVRERKLRELWESIVSQADILIERNLASDRYKIRNFHTCRSWMRKVDSEWPI